MSSVPALLDMEYGAALAEIDRLKVTIENTEKSLDRDRLRMAELEIRAVELRASAGVLRERNVHVERNDAGVLTLTVDPA